MLAWLILSSLMMPVLAHHVALLLFVFRAYLISHVVKNTKSIFKDVV
jgi:hypothetical protein